jgi:hypothetical protein
MIAVTIPPHRRYQWANAAGAALGDCGVGSFLRGGRKKVILARIYAAAQREAVGRCRQMESTES